MKNIIDFLNQMGENIRNIFHDEQTWNIFIAIVTIAIPFAFIMTIHDFYVDDKSNKEKEKRNQKMWIVAKLNYLEAKNGKQTVTFNVIEKLPSEGDERKNKKIKEIKAVCLAMNEYRKAEIRRFEYYELVFENDESEYIAIKI